MIKLMIRVLGKSTIGCLNHRGLIPNNAMSQIR
ncbi:hypothetical protein LCGC14_0414290 [marine sediment metagenome]|uniref:Uncharacterized protein n=1 Tax=marine sediment metagenome TaxID=412755 RepID=A0A0F9SYL3_9ZZZZ